MRVFSILGLLAMLGAACAQTTATKPVAGQVGAPGVEQSAAPRTLRVAVRSEPASLSGVILIPANLTTGTQRRLFNAGMALPDADHNPQPYLVEGLPRLNTDAWRVLPDGRMETVYQLRPNLTWHDGAAFSSEDFVFAWRVYATPEFGVSGTSPHTHMEEVLAPDARTLVIRWKRPFPEAGNLWGFAGSGMESATFTPLPSHILAPYASIDREAFGALPFWTTEYVGMGPFRLERWERGAFIDAAAFDAHALGRPRIDRLRVTWSEDANALLAAILAGEVDLPVDDSIRLQQGIVLKREWEERARGTVQFRPTLWRKIDIQWRADVVIPRAVHDLAVRRALAHAIDKETINESMLDGQGILSDVPYIAPSESYFPEIERALPRYPYDVRRSEQVMFDAGYRKGGDAVYASPTEGRLTFNLSTIGSAQNEAERSVIADGWRRAGFDIEEGVFGAAQSRDVQTLSTFKTLSSTSIPHGAHSAVHQTSAAIPRPETRWTGFNRGAWSNPEYDRLYELFQTTLEPPTRIQHLTAALRILSEELGVLPLYFNPGVLGLPASLHGIQVRSASAEMSWNVHQWELR